MAWPSVSDFSRAIQHPGRCFSHWELTQGEIAVYETGGRAGMPLVSSGNFAAVYKVTSNGHDFAIRVFTRAVNDQEDRYTQLHTFLRSSLPQSFVEFEYLQHGILFEGNWYPLVKMDWVEGAALDKFVELNLANPQILQTIAARWRGAVSEISGLGIAHNDLQHGNVMVKSDRTLRLVDYDAMFLPDYAGQNSPENGHQNFQHPLKTSRNYNEHIDHFPALVIYVSLLAIAADPGLFNKFYNDDNLLFTKADYADPFNSECFRILKNNNPDDAVRHLAEELERLCNVDVDRVPELKELLDQAPSSRPAQAANPSPPAAPATSAPPPSATADPQTSTGSAYRDLLQGIVPQATAPPAAPARAPTASPQPTPVAPPAAPPPGRVAILTCPACGSASPTELIYCENQSCIAAIRQDQVFCRGCGTQIPSNAVHCHECGLKK